MNEDCNYYDFPLNNFGNGEYIFGSDNFRDSDYTSYFETQKKVEVLRKNLKRWINIQNQMCEHYDKPFYHSHMKIIHAELDQLEDAMYKLGYPYPYREGQKSRRLIFTPKNERYTNQSYGFPSHFTSFQKAQFIAHREWMNLQHLEVMSRLHKNHQ